MMCRRIIDSDSDRWNPHIGAPIGITHHSSL
jgi:hypothetical protein